MGPSGGSAILSAVQDMLQRRMQRGIAGDQNALAQRKLDQDENNESERSMSMLEKIKMQGDTALARATLLDNQKAAERQLADQQGRLGWQARQDLAEQRLAAEKEQLGIKTKSAADIASANREAQMARQQLHDAHNSTLQRFLNAATNASGEERARIMAQAKQYASDNGLRGDEYKVLGMLFGDEKAAEAQAAQAAGKGMYTAGSVPGVKKVVDDTAEKARQAEQARKDWQRDHTGGSGAGGTSHRSGSTQPAYPQPGYQPPPALTPSATPEVPAPGVRKKFGTSVDILPPRR